MLPNSISRFVCEPSRFQKTSRIFLVGFESPLHNHFRLPSGGKGATLTTSPRMGPMLVARGVNPEKSV